MPTQRVAQRSSCGSLSDPQRMITPPLMFLIFIRREEVFISRLTLYYHELRFTLPPNPRKFSGLSAARVREIPRIPWFLCETENGIGWGIETKMQIKFSSQNYTFDPRCLVLVAEPRHLFAGILPRHGRRLPAPDLEEMAMSKASVRCRPFLGIPARPQAELRHMGCQGTTTALLTLRSEQLDRGPLPGSAGPGFLA